MLLSTGVDSFSMRRLSVVLLVTTTAFILSTCHAFRDRYTSSNVTQTLDMLLASDRYDKRLRPGFGGPPITVAVNLFIKSIGPVSDNDESFGLDCYFRQHWYDVRLQYEKVPGLEELSMSWLFLDRVWKPDTYFVNGKKSFLHRITAPNKFLRLRYDGFLTYSMRLTILASCPMYLKKFPLDAQKCPLQLGSYGYSSKDIVYKWTDEAGIGLQEGVEIAQFDLVNITKEDEKLVLRGGLPYSTIQADFWLKRHTGYFMLQVYVPCGLIVLSSWVSFWIDPDDVAARVALGVTTVLSLTTLGFGGRSQMPKVSYCTALDWFVIICFTYVFSVMIEYAVVNLNDKFNKDLKKMIESQREEAEKSKTAELELNKNVEAFDRQGMFKIYRSVSHSTFFLSTSHQKHEKMRIEQGTVFTKLNPTDSLSKEFIKTVIAHLEEPQVKVRWKSCPNFYMSEWEDGREYSDEGDREEDILEISLDLESQGVSPEVKDVRKSRTIGTRLKEIKTFLDFRDKSGKPCPTSEYSILDSTDKFSELDVRSRKNFPVAFVVSLIIYALAFTYYFTDENPDWETSRRI
ncbi:hypothetical protein RUM44_005052 [Polyplax serrata]|uniref:Uncharacterized protein n=1 Tax=Polyplax serrata TaxID=468196 RepID=A0ABR1AWW9_POLSC